MTKATKEILKEAKALLSKRGGWMQGDWDNGDQMCAIGAIRRVTGKHDLYSDSQEPAVLALAEALPACFTKTYGKDVVSFNDASGRRKQDILALFNYAIKGKRMPSPKKERD